MKMKGTGNVIFSTISNSRASVKLEVNQSRKVDGSLTTYELADGTEIEILSLTPDQFIEEKIAAYADRRFVRDLYDIYHLTKSYKIMISARMRLKQFLYTIQRPVDEPILRSIVYIGLAPTFDRMFDGIRRHIE